MKLPLYGTFAAVYLLRVPLAYPQRLMLMHMKGRIFVAVVLLALLVGCKPKGGSEIFDYGKVENGRYTNTFFGCSMDVPEGWTPLTKEQIAELESRGRKIAVGEESKPIDGRKASDISAASIMTVYKHPYGTVQGYNPSMSLIVENLHRYGSIKNGDQYLGHSRGRLVSYGLFQSVDSVFTKEVVNGAIFYRMHCVSSTDTERVEQDYIATVVNRFALTFILSYRNDSEKELMMKSLQSFVLSRKP